MDIFSRADQGHALHLRPTLDGIINPKMRSELMLKGVRVTRPFIKATMAFACGCNPLGPDDPTLSSWDADVIAYKPAHHSAFEELMVDDVDDQQRAMDSVIVQDCSEVAFAVMALKPGPGFVESIKGLRRAHVYKWLFQDCATLGHILHTGFTFCIDNIVESPDVSLLQRKRILQTKEKFRGSPQFYEPVFGADLGLDVSDFLGSCVYVNMKKAVQVITSIGHCLLPMYDAFVGLISVLNHNADMSHANGLCRLDSSHACVACPSASSKTSFSSSLTLGTSTMRR